MSNIQVFKNNDFADNDELSIKDIEHINVDNFEPIPVQSFPNQPRSGSYNIPTTIPNVKQMLTLYSILVSYNVISKKIIIVIPGLTGTIDNAENVAMSYIISLAILNGMSIGQVPEFVYAIADRNQTNPVADWINSKPWDGVDRLQSIYDTLVAREDYPEALKQVLMYRWLISTVAAAFMPRGFHARGVLTTQGGQSMGKTAWIKALIIDPILKEQVLKLDHHLDPSNKDSLLTAISHWIVEIGELDSSFKKDIARLKGFLTSNSDKVRKPYGRTNSEYPRKTVFYATVNETNFLVDPTGNTRWWTIPVTSINYTHDIDTQQLFAQIAIDFNAGEPWWLSSAEEKCLEKFNDSHRNISAIHEGVLEILDMDHINDTNLPLLSASDVLKRLGIHTPSNSQSKEVNKALRELLGDSKRIQGVNKWRVPLRQFTNATSAYTGSNDDYLY
jgi:putative DNA primase/helicase